jgi:enoyl-CoA hydratase/carnithine racemase
LTINADVDNLRRINCGAIDERPGRATDMTAATDDVLLDVTGGIARLRINRPAQRNALSASVFSGLREGVAAVARDNSARVLVLEGAGDTAFCAGGDLREMAADGDALQAHRNRGMLAELFGDLWRLGKPTIARVQGYALAGGFGLALACDFVVASDRAVFGVPEVHVGLWPYMVTVPLLHWMPPKQALSLMLTARRVSAPEAARLGFVSDVVPHHELDEAVASLADELRQAAPQAVALGRTAFYTAVNGDVDTRLQMLQAALTVNLGVSDAREGTTAFAEKRLPAWRTR